VVLARQRPQADAAAPRQIVQRGESAMRLANGNYWYEYPPNLFTDESGGILWLCGASSGVAWRYSRRNAISAVRREAVARLDEFVGPRY
jgi:hypothetical protein